MSYWLDLFTGTTWEEFQKDGAKVSGFSDRMRKAVAKMKQGDIMLCYLTGVMRWVGALEVLGASDDQRRIWKDAQFPARVNVKPLLLLAPEHGIPMSELAGKVDFYSSPAHRGKFKGFVRMSPNLFKRDSDGALIFELLKKAQKEPVARPVDAKKLARRPFFRAEQKKGKKTISAVVSVPEPETEQVEKGAGEGEMPESGTSTTRHTEIQHHLLNLGAEMGYDVWVAKNDRSKSWNGSVLGKMPRIVDELPTQFNEATNRTIELIDILWLKGNSIAAAFEVECTTSIYSGLLRMSDLLALQPNLEINLFLVAPDERRDKVEQEILRPTFSLREKPLARICGFIGFKTLTEKLEGIRKLGLASSLKADFLLKTAEFFEQRLD
ncbi:MAG: hypothetical protein WCV00_23315 [Verrucomicrobiia bacterium]|jgi:hypothetical protein